MKVKFYYGNETIQRLESRIARLEKKSNLDLEIFYEEMSSTRTDFEKFSVVSSDASGFVHLKIGVFNLSCKANVDRDIIYVEVWDDKMNINQRFELGFSGYFNAGFSVIKFEEDLTEILAKVIKNRQNYLINTYILNGKSL